MQPVRKFIILFFVSLFLFGLFPGNPTQAQSMEDVDLSATLSYLQSQLQPDGGFPGLSEGSDPGTTARALLAFSLNEIDPNQFVSSEGKTPVDYLLDTYQNYIFDDNGLLFPGNAGLILAGLSLYQAAPEELSAQLLETLQTDGSFSTTATKDWSSGAVTDLNQALVILGLAAHKDTIPASSIEYLLGNQLEDGTWDNGFGSDPDTTALVIIALLASGQVDDQHPAIQKALQYFKDNQLDNAAWRPAWDTSEFNVDTTGWITLALTSVGEDLSNWSKNGSNPRDPLKTAIQQDGSIGTGFINVYSTVEALLGFAEKPIISPLSKVDVSPQKAGLVVTLPDGSSLLRCVEFTGETISGFELLEKSGLALETSFDPSKGNAVCGIEGQGCGNDNCFCGVPDYWSYWHLDGAEWSYSQWGANTFDVLPETVDGWSWGDQPPALSSFEEICAENPLLYLPAVVKEDQEPTSSILLPLVENAGDSEELSSTPKPTESQNAPIQNNPQYFVFGAVILILVVVLVLVLREKRKN